MIKFEFGIPVDAEIDIREYVGKKLRVKLKGNVEVLKKSLDARDKRDIRYVYSVAVETENDVKAMKNGGKSYVKEEDPVEKILKDVRYKGRPIVVGAGPAGLFCALTLAKAGIKPVVIERGERVEERKKTVEIFNKTLKLEKNSNVLFGEGGAGTFSDGKLNTGISSPYIKSVLKDMVAFGAPEEILYLGKPHVGTDILENVVKNIRNFLTERGAEFHFGTIAEDFLSENGKIKGIVTNKGEFYSDKVFLAIGHSARDTFETLFSRGIKMESKIFSMGVRIEHLQTEIDFARYGRERGKLPPADYKAAVPLSDGNKLYTFCMCPGGTVVNASSERGINVNGMSNYARDGKNANSALLVNVTEEHFGEGVLAGVNYQRKWESRAYDMTGSYRPPAQTFGDFIRGKIGEFGEIFPTVGTGYEICDLNSLLPKHVIDGLKEGIPAIGRKIKGFDVPSAVMTGIEARSSSPVRILRDETFSSSLKGLYPIGEGAGYAGGITSAAVDGIRAAISAMTE